MRALIFDFGGVLMKTVDYQPRLAWDQRLGLQPGTVEQTVHNPTSWVQAQLGAIPTAEYWLDVQTRLGLTAAETKQLAVDFYSGDRLDESLVAAIRASNADVIALLSNDSVELRPKLERLALVDLFDPLVISAEIGAMKPDPVAYRTVLERAGCTPDDAVFIDDRPENVEGARRVGIEGVHYTPGLDLADWLNT
jgi:HAD superfamily hydrolase (TIGR01509 family)